MNYIALHPKFEMWVVFLIDPTAGPPASEQTSWWLDGLALHENVKKTLVKFCVPSPMVYRYLFRTWKGSCN